MLRSGLIRLPVLLAGVAIAWAVATSARADDHRDRDRAESRSLLARAAGSGRAGTFVAAVVLADLIPALKADGALTVLVPTDEAFGRLDESTRRELFSPDGAAKLQAILKYHIIPGRVLARQITGDLPRTLSGERWTVASNGRGIAINNATVVEADVLARNGVIHFVDAVLQAPEPDLLGVAAKAGQFDILLAALEAAGLDEKLRGDGPFTILAPTDEAFGALGKATLGSLLEKPNRAKLQEILKYHVIAGSISAQSAVAAGRVETLQGGSVPVAISRKGKVAIGPGVAVAADLKARNGVIHAIDTVLVPDPKK